MEREKMDKILRAKQFLPFDALKGFYKMINKSSIEKCERVVLEDDGIKNLLFKLNQIKKGMMVKVIYYDKDHYETKEGLLARVNMQCNFIYIVKTKILISDILDIYSKDIINEEFVEI